ncbi:MAG: protein kinase [Planctomycetes bacterium]|nr:protein kinase [Planctomycetota bacterium]
MTPPTATVSAGSLGEWCIRRGFAREDQIRDCLQFQHDEELARRPAPRLGELLVRKGILTPEQVTQALGEQQTEIRYCPVCRIRVNVSIRGDAVFYRCVRCQGPLVTPEAAVQLDVVDDSVIVVSREPLPLEVRLAVHIPERQFGKYILVRELGAGGVGKVDQAWDTYLSQYVALKRLKAEVKGETRQMKGVRTVSLLKEARHSIRLRHPNIVSVFDVGRINREFYIAMEYLDGETLHKWNTAARERGKPSYFHEHPKRSLRLLIEVARAVHYAHTRPSPIIHCDLKPANIIIDPAGGSHVCDFGLARNLRTDVPEGEGDITGTPSYMAPEQASGRSGEIDARTDVWALGAILYELITGQPPFVGEPFEIIHRTISEVPRPPKDVLRETTRRMKLGSDEIATRMLLQIPDFLMELCMRCLSREREKRPGSMGEVADAMEQGLKAPQVERSR